MQACAYCGEKIKKDARLCRYCQRPAIFSLWIDQVLGEKACFEFLKVWNSFKFSKDSGHLRLSSLGDAKQALNKLPLEIAWDLNLQESEELEFALQKFKVQRRRPELQENTSIVRERKFANLWTTAFAIVLVSVGIAAAVYWQNQKIPDPPTSSNFSPIADPGQFAFQAIPEHVGSENAVHDSGNFTNSPSPSLSKNDIQRLLNSTVFIRGASSLGTGFFITEDGYVLSNNHVVENMDQPLVILRTGAQYTAKKVKLDPQKDLALLKIDVRGAPYLSMGDANQIYPGQNVLTIGNPSGLSFTLTRGIVSFVGRELNGVRYIQTDSAINPGNSGGPMITEDGKVIGVNTLTATQQKGISFALPINYAFQSGGLAESIGDFPQGAPSFQGDQEVVTQASLQRPVNPSEPDLPVDTFQKESIELGLQFKENDGRYEAEVKKLQERNQAITDELAKNPSKLSVVESLKRERLENDLKIKSLVRDQVDGRIRYVEQLISLYQRQKGDSRFQNLGPEIDRQINALQAQRRQLIDER